MRSLLKGIIIHHILWNSPYMVIQVTVQAFAENAHKQNIICDFN